VAVACLWSPRTQAPACLSSGMRLLILAVHRSLLRSERFRDFPASQPGAWNSTLSPPHRQCSRYRHQTAPYRVRGPGVSRYGCGTGSWASSAGTRRTLNAAAAEQYLSDAWRCACRRRYPGLLRQGWLRYSNRTLFTMAVPQARVSRSQAQI
jgi:hypothetical protein